MTVERDRMRLVSGTATRLVFLEELEPLPLTDPTEAAQFLGMKRHTLACYRSLGEGPPYYKFGRWIRYAWTDLRGGSGAESEVTAWTSPELEEAVQTGALLLVDTPTAARFLRLSRFCLSNYRAGGGGPRFCRFGRRIHYPVDELLVWARRQRRPLRPLVRNALLAESRV